MKILCFASSILLSAIAGFFIANLLDNSRHGEEIRFIQAEKIDADLASLKEVKNYLNAGCLGSARQQIDNKMDQDLMLLSEHVRLFPNGKYAARLKKDDPVLYGVIRDYGTDWKKTYFVDPCAN